MSEFLRVAVFSDIHANAVALEAVLDHIDKHKNVDYLVAAGDLLTDGPLPRETWNLLNEANCKFVRGNHEDYLLGDYSEAEQRLSPKILQELRCVNTWTAQQLGDDIKQKVEKFPLHLRFSPARGHDMLVMHATLSSCHRYVAQDFLSDIELEEKYGGSGAEVLVFGHYHSTYNFKRGNQHFVNVASVSLPNDGLPLASYGLFTWRRDHWEVEQCRIPYDRDKFIRHYLDWDVPDGKIWQRSLLGIPVV